MNYSRLSPEKTATHEIATLNSISVARRFNTWMYQRIKPFLNGEILEIGSGIGNITECVISDHVSVTASDFNPDYNNMLHDRFGTNVYMHEIRNIDIIHPEFENLYSDLFEKFDSVFALNIIEHIENDVFAIHNCSKFLREGGRLIILVPAYPWLYNEFDKELKHYRRYSRKQIKELLLSHGFVIDKVQYFNFVGVFGWFLFGKVFKRKIISANQMGIYNVLVPFIKLIDKVIFNNAGLSLIVCGTKKKML